MYDTYTDHCKCKKCGQWFYIRVLEGELLDSETCPLCGSDAFEELDRVYITRHGNPEYRWGCI